MELASLQRKLLGLVRSSHQPLPEEDPYLREVAGSRDLAEARNNIFLWRVYVLERACPLTFRLLQQRQLLVTELKAFISRHNISPFREVQGPSFLASIARHPDSLVASMAQFELALMRVRAGDDRSHLVSWDCEPLSVLSRLAKGLAVDQPPSNAGTYRIRVSRELPGCFEVLEASLDQR